MRVLTLISLAALTACTAIPERLNTSDQIAEGCGYKAEDTAAGFALEVACNRYSFFPTSDAAVEDARAAFAKTAAVLAERRGRKIQPLTVADMNAAPARNSVDGRYLVYVTGRIQFTQ